MINKATTFPSEGAAMQYFIKHVSFCGMVKLFNKICTNNFPALAN